MLSWASCPSKVFSDRPIVGGDLHFRHHQNASITVESPPGDRTAFSGQPGSCKPEIIDFLTFLPSVRVPDVRPFLI